MSSDKTADEHFPAKRGRKLGMTLTFKMKKNLLFFFITINTREKIVEITVLSFNLEKLTNKYFGSLKNMFYRFLKKKKFFSKKKKNKKKKKVVS